MHHNNSCYICTAAVMAAVRNIYVVSGLMAINYKRLALEMMLYTDINMNRFVYCIVLVNSVCVNANSYQYVDGAKV